MKDKISKIKSIFKKDGFFGAIKKIFKYIKSEFIYSISIVSNIRFLFNKNKISKDLDELLKKEKYDRIIIWRSSFGWNVPLFQRPQHIANNLSKQKSLIFYEVTKMTDKVNLYEKLNHNLYLVNLKNKRFKKLLIDKIKDINKPKYLQFYSTDWTMPVNYIKQYVNDGFKIIYEYIDDLNPALAGTKELPVNIKEKYEYCMRDTENVFVVVTADLLKEDAISKRGMEKVVLSTNGVDYNFFKKKDKKYKYEEEFEKILEEGKPIVCYYGALAKWFDYDLIKKIAKTNKYNIVLFGIKYDEAFDNSEVSKYSNIHFLGSRNYKVLKNYAAKADILMIPFLINEITKSTSPVKIFEYMALHKPIVTTAMHECMKYKSVLIGKNKKDFIEKLDEALLIKKNKDYINLLDREARENDWSNKAKLIIDVLKEGE